VKIAELKDHTKWITDFESEYTKDLDKLETSLPTEGKVEKDKKKRNK
jgi:hypothetical protein